MIGEFSGTRQRETREVQPEERLQREAAQANRQDDFVRLQAEEKQMQAVTGGVLPETKESVSSITFNRWTADKYQASAIDAYHNGLIDKANEHIDLCLQLNKIADQYEVEKVAGKKPMSESQLHKVTRKDGAMPRRETEASSQPAEIERVEQRAPMASQEMPSRNDTLRYHQDFLSISDRGTGKGKEPSNGEWSSMDHDNHAENLHNPFTELFRREKEGIQRMMDTIDHRLALIESESRVERGQSDASDESPGMRDVLRNHDAFSTVASPETSGLASQGATPLERRELKRPEVKKKGNKFVKVLEKVIDCVSCNVELKAPKVGPNPDQVRFRQMIANAEEPYLEEWKNTPEYRREQNRKALRGIHG